MNMRSHVDPCTFVAFIHVPRSALDSDFIDELRRFSPEQGASPDILHALPERSHQVRFHEDYHFWQGLRLPFVYRYATLSLRQFNAAFRQLAEAEKDYRRWSCVLPEFERMSLEERIGRNGSELFWGRDEAKFPDKLAEEIRLRPLDLLECATSLAEFQVTVKGDKSDPIVLSRWAKRNPAYLEPYEFAARFLDDQRLALRCSLSLINAAFHTSEPVRAFMELLGRTWGIFKTGNSDAAAFLKQPEPCRWSDLYSNLLAELPYEAKPDADGRILGSPYHRITLESWVGGAITTSDGFITHPFLGPPARLWIEEEKRNPEYSLAMNQPAWLRSETFWKLRNGFGPTLTIYRFLLGHGEDRILMTGAANGSAFTSLHFNDKSEWRGFVADLLSMYGTVRRASGAHFDEAQRTCHHSGCPSYKINCCNMYPIVPKEFEACGFPGRVQRLIDISRG